VTIWYWIRTVFYLGPVVGVLTTACGTVATVLGFVDRSGRKAYHVGQVWGRLLCRVSGVRVDVRGLERLVPGKTYVFVANHQSLYDIPAVFGAVPYQLRVIAKQELRYVPFVGWHLSQAGHILVNRANPDRFGILAQWRRLYKQGLSLIIFPEGTRSRDGRIAKFKAGSFVVAIEAGLPVVPISLVGTRAVLRKGSLLVRPGTVTLTFHDPIATDSGMWKPTIEDARRLGATARDIIVAEVDRATAAGAR
jgi:1-acyl-sn-glycerol-3-phosphate acyltransferase